VIRDQGSVFRAELRFVVSQVRRKNAPNLGHPHREASMNAADLKEYGLKPVARVHIEGKDLKIKIVDLEAAKHKE
jgi:hypothetical protein